MTMQRISAALLHLLAIELCVHAGARFVTRQLQSGVRGARVVGVRTLTFASFLAVVLLAAKVPCWACVRASWQWPASCAAY